MESNICETFSWHQKLYLNSGSKIKRKLKYANRRKVQNCLSILYLEHVRTKWRGVFLSIHPLLLFFSYFYFPNNTTPCRYKSKQICIRVICMQYCRMLWMAWCLCSITVCFQYFVDIELIHVSWITLPLFYYTMFPATYSVLIPWGNLHSLHFISLRWTYL